MIHLFREDASRLMPAAQRAIQLALIAERDKFEREIDLGRAIGISQQTVNKILTKGRCGPGVAMQICSYLKISIEDLVAKYQDQIKAEDAPRVDLLAALAQWSQPVREVLESAEYRPETELQVELYYRALKAGGNEPSVIELTRVAEQYDAANTAAAKRRK